MFLHSNRLNLKMFKILNEVKILENCPNYPDIFQIFEFQRLVDFEVHRAPELNFCGPISTHLPAFGFKLQKSKLEDAVFPKKAERHLRMAKKRQKLKTQKT